MKKFNALTMAFSLAVLAVIIVFDVWTLIHRGFDTTISAQTYTLAKDQPIIAFALGVVCGHLFWPNKLAVTDLQK